MDDTEDGGGPLAEARTRGGDLLHGIARESVRARLFGESATKLLGERYRVLRRIGQGGMGAVYLAFDVRLERQVAIKVLHAGATEHERPRLVREALLMARVPSVHVVPVYDVGHDDEQAFVAMEYVPGPSLRQWWTERDRTWKEVLAVVIEAGRGLAAAHAAGVVHRDFKPDNVLIDADSRARVVDFGLASVGAIEVEETARERAQTLRMDAPVLTTLTRTGEVVGTPRYMAPEQFEARVATEATDQFALCVTLYEGLYGQRPFEGSNIAELSTAVMLGEVREPPTRTDVPGWLWPVIRRGLAVDPAERHPSVAALLAALQSDPLSRRRRLAAGIGLVAIGGATATAVAMLAGGSDGVCELDEDRFAGVWDDATRAAMRSAFESSGRPHAPATFDRVAARLSAWSEAWREQWVGACEAAARKEQSETVLDLRMACLERGRVSLRAVTELLRSPPGPATVDKALDVVKALPRLERCADVEALMAAYPPPDAAEDRAEADAIATGLAEVHALTDAGAYPAAREALTPLLDRARTLDHPPLLGESLLLDGILLRHTATEAEAEAVLHEAATVAATGRDDHGVGKAWLHLTAVTRSQGDYDKARELGSVAAIAIARAGSPPDLVGTLANERGILARIIGDYPAASEQFETARAAWAEAHGEESSEVAIATLNLGSVAEHMGRIDEAAERFERALELGERAVGPAHPTIAPALSHLGQIAQMRGRLDEAQAYYERVLRIDTATHGPEHEDIAYTLLDLGNLEMARGRCGEATRYYLRVREILVKAYGSEHPNIVVVESNLGSCAKDEQRYDAAREHYQRALDLAERALGADHPTTASMLSNLGVLEEAEGKHAEARAFHERALALRRSKLGPEHPETINSVRNLAFVAMSEEKWDEAESLYTQALESLVRTFGREQIDVAITHRELARIAAARSRTARAREHYAQAIEIYGALGRADEQAVAELRDELAALR